MRGSSVGPRAETWIEEYSSVQFIERMKQQQNSLTEIRTGIVLREGHQPFHESTLARVNLDDDASNDSKHHEEDNGTSADPKAALVSFVLLRLPLRLGALFVYALLCPFRFAGEIPQAVQSSPGCHPVAIQIVALHSRCHGSPALGHGWSLDSGTTCSTAHSIGRMRE